MKHKILIIDDSTAILEMLKYSLTKHALSVFTAEDGHVALKLATKERFDLIISDIEMPVMTGVDFGLELRRLKNMTPILFYSVYDKFAVEAQEALNSMERITIIKDKDTKKLLEAVEAFVRGELFA